jgi:hypothetical protein
MSIGTLALGISISLGVPGLVDQSASQPESDFADLI